MKKEYLVRVVIEHVFDIVEAESIQEAIEFFSRETYTLKGGEDLEVYDLSNPKQYTVDIVCSERQRR